MEQAMTTCDQCGAKKLGVDHWFKVSTDVSAVQMVLGTEDSADSGKPARHICGADCLMKEVAEWAARMTPMQGQSTGTEQTPWPFTLANIVLG